MSAAAWKRAAEFMRHESVWVRAIQIWKFEYGWNIFSLSRINFRTIFHMNSAIHAHDILRITQNKHTSLLLMPRNSSEEKSAGDGFRKIISNSHQRTISIWIVTNENLFRHSLICMHAVRMDRSFECTLTHAPPTPHAITFTHSCYPLIWRNAEANLCTKILINFVPKSSTAFSLRLRRERDGAVRCAALIFSIPPPRCRQLRH